MWYIHIIHIICVLLYQIEIIYRQLIWKSKTDFSSKKEERGAHCLDGRNDSTVHPINNREEIAEENMAVTKVSNDSNDKDKEN